MSIMAKTPSGYKKIGSAYLGERPVDKVFNANGDVVYALQRELTGVPPLLFKGKEQTELLNYRIYGDTVDGESVGDRTGNLCEDRITGANISSNGHISTDVPFDVGYAKINEGYTYTVNGYVVAFFTEKPKENDRSYNNSRIVGAYPATFEAPISGYVAFRVNAGSQLQCNKGSSLLPYEPYGYRVPVTVTNGTDTQTIPIYLPEPIKMVGDEAEYIDYKEQKLHRVRKNLLQNTATSRTINGVTFTVNEDGSVTCNGTANDTILYEIHRFPRFSGKCILSGCPINGSKNTCRLQYTDMSRMAYQEYGIGVDIYQFDETQYPNSRINIRIENGYSCDNLTFYPMIRKADIEDDTYEPYIESTDLDVTLPALPTIKGTNTMSIDTTVQPSRIDIKGRIKTLT